ncbi:endoglucanase type k, partial [Colletotrichum incanum]
LTCIMRIVDSFSLAAAMGLLTITMAVSGIGKSTRYWDCCKPSCAWPEKASVNQPVLTCDKNDSPLDPDAKSGCVSGGSAYTCTNQAPWAINDLVSFGFAATAINGGTEASWCCGCYAITFTSGKNKGKIMVVQSTNTGGDLGSNHFDIMMPGGGLGIFDGCTSEFGFQFPGTRYGGVSSRSECSALPSKLQGGCYWRFDWFMNADNPNLSFTQVQCPAELVARSGCRRSDDASFPAFQMPTNTKWDPPQSTEAAGPNEQCDSITWDAQKKCPSGYYCKYVTDYYWQCVQGTNPTASVSSSSSRTSSTTSASTSSRTSTMSIPQPTSTAISTSTTLIASTTTPFPVGGTVPVWAQCNAISWPTASACAAGAVCVSLNPFYWQCQPTGT